MPLNQSFIFNLSQEFTEIALALEIRTIEELRRVTNRLIDNPDDDFEGRIQRFTQTETQKFLDEADKWILATFPTVYLAGLNRQDADLRGIASPRNQGNPVPPPRFENRAFVSGSVREALADFPQHNATYSAYERTFRETVRRSGFPYYESTLKQYNRLHEISISNIFKRGDRATRIDLAQRILDTLDMKTVVFPSGHIMSIEAFAQREARAYTQAVAVQGQISRAVERGYDLVQINQYAGASPMCEPYQGKVFSLSGDSSQYPPLDDAIFSGSWDFGGGIYHDYCGHFQSTYIPGVSEGLNGLSDDPVEQAILDDMGQARGNRFIYEQRQVQRKNEYQIRQYKKRVASSLDPTERRRNEALVRRWQERQREWIKENPFLKRNYTREAV